MIDVSVQNAFALVKLTYFESNNNLRLRLTWIEKLGLDLIITNAKRRYDVAAKQNWKHRNLKHRLLLEEFFQKVFLLLSFN
jgi:hypothetical protein